MTRPDPRVLAASAPPPVSFRPHLDVTAVPSTGASPYTRKGPGAARIGAAQVGWRTVMLGIRTGDTVTEIHLGPEALLELAVDAAAKAYLLDPDLQPPRPEQP